MPASIRLASPDAGDIDAALSVEDIPSGGADCIGALACGRRSSFSYHRLPEPLLRLTVRKLDASCFDVQIARSAAVWELKAAIEDVFFAIYDDPERTISWQHVWSHFCLCFKDEKLTDDKATLRAFGIRDGDELHFVQHLSIDYNPCNSLSKNNKMPSHRRSRTSFDGVGFRQRTLLDDLNEDEDAKFTDLRRSSTSALEEDLCVYQQNEQCIEGSCKKGSFFRGWFSGSRLRCNRTHAEDTVPLSGETRNTRPKLGKWLSSKRSKIRR